jgi:exosortase
MAAFVAVTLIVFWRAVSALAVFSFQHEFSSHVPLIPVLSLYLFYIERRVIFRDVQSSVMPGGILIVVGVTLYVWVMAHASLKSPAEFLPGSTLAMVVVWMGGFFVCYGYRAWRAAAFPLLFLLLMVPLPEQMLARTIDFLQVGSTSLSFSLFKLVGVPVFRQGFLLSVPGQTIEVAKECSGIRSSIALLITCLLAAHLFLRTPWKMLLFVALVLPVSIVKNAIRIVTLTLLSIYVDPGFLRGNLHHDGGFVFFLLALAILFPVLLLLQKSEKHPGPSAASIPTDPASGLARG